MLILLFGVVGVVCGGCCMLLPFAVGVVCWCCCVLVLVVAAGVDVDCWFRW